MTAISVSQDGPACEQCLAHVLLERLGQPKRWTFSFHEPESAVTWNVDRAYELVRVRPRPARRIAPASLCEWLERYSEHHSAHIDHIPSDKLGEPGILVVFDVRAPPDFEPSPFVMLIDGTHRAAAAIRDGRDFYAYGLTEVEQRACVIEYRVEGRLAELPQFAGPPFVVTEAWAANAGQAW